MVTNLQKLMDQVMPGYKKYYTLLCKFTFKCDSYCDICSESCSMDETDFLSLELIGKALEEIKDLDIVFTLQGGEVMLYPEHCKNIGDLWRQTKGKYSKKLDMVTNGFWGKDPKLIDYVLEEIKPTLIAITVDKWHQKSVPISSINNIIKVLENHPITDICIFQIYSKNFPLVESKNYKELGLEFSSNVEPFIYGIPFHRTGKALSLEGIDESPDLRECNNEELECQNIGIGLYPNGIIGGECTLARNGCRFGHIKTHNLKDIFKKLETIKRPSIKYTGLMDNFCSLCREMKIKPLEELMNGKN